MNEIMGMLIEGVILAAMWMVVAVIVRPRIARYGHVAGVIVAAAFYVWFALRAGDYIGLAIEFAGLAGFAALAVKGFRHRTSTILAVAWALHPVWDVALHSAGHGTYAPLNYVVFCISFDLLIAAFVWRSQRAPITSRALAAA
jgi:hypothetical protein